VVFGFLAIGTAFYSIVEGWTVLDAPYYSLVALTTVGFGEIHPELAVSKLFTIVYLLAGVGVRFLAPRSRLVGCCPTSDPIQTGAVRNPTSANGRGTTGENARLRLASQSEVGTWHSAQSKYSS